MRREFVLCVDGGQSSTLALLATLEGRVIGFAKGGPSNHVTEPGGMERMRRTLHAVISGAFESAGLQPVGVRSACFGMTGGADRVEGIVSAFLTCDTLCSVHDVVTALAGASIARPGVVVIAGTGAIAYGRSADDREAKASGWGYLMGDEGGAYDIGRVALCAAAQALDGRAASTLLTEMIPRHFDCASLYKVHAGIYGGDITRPQIASLASVVWQAAVAGDEVACGVLADAGQQLAQAALAVIVRLDAQETGMPVYPVGGVFQAGDWILVPFRDALEAASPASHIERPAFAPVVGALLMALQNADVPIDDALVDTIRATLPAVAHSKTME